MLQHDAACRVIARLKKERDDARMLLSQSERQIQAESANAAVVSNGKRGSENPKHKILNYTFITEIYFIAFDYICSHRKRVGSCCKESSSGYKSFYYCRTY